VKRADLVVVLEDGRISQMGTHDELMRQAGHYREIAAVQLYGDSEERPAQAVGTAVEHPSHMKRVHDKEHVAAAAAKATEAERDVEMPMGQ